MTRREQQIWNIVAGAAMAGVRADGGDGRLGEASGILRFGEAFGCVPTCYSHRVRRSGRGELR